MLGRARLLPLVALAACSVPATQRLNLPDGGPSGPCDPAVPPAPRAFIGPDLRLAAPCGSNVSGAVASVNEEGDGVTSWSASVSGDRSIALVQGSFKTCLDSGPSVASVIFAPPLAAKPGDAFDATVSIAADGDAFPPGTVKVHAAVVAPAVSLAPDTIDFGEVGLGQFVSTTAILRNESAAALYVLLPTPSPPFDFGSLQPILVRPGDSACLIVSLGAAHEGDFNATATWTATARTDVTMPDGCVATKSVSVHARVVSAPSDAGPADASAD
jgi:hypothetical protein